MAVRTGCGATWSEPTRWRRNDHRSEMSKVSIGRLGEWKGEIGRKRWEGSISSQVASDAVSRLPWADGADHGLSYQSLAGPCSKHPSADQNGRFGWYNGSQSSARGCWLVPGNGLSVWNTKKRDLIPQCRASIIFRSLSVLPAHIIHALH